MHSPGDAVSPKEIIVAILAEFEQTVEPSHFRNYVRNHFRAYLHPEDHERLQRLFGRMREEAFSALDEKMRTLNRKGRRDGMLAFGRNRDSRRFESTGPWNIEFLRNDDDDSAQQRLIVESSTIIPPDMSNLEGDGTIRVGKPQAPASDPGTQRTERFSGPNDTPPQAAVFARLNFKDDRPELQSFAVTKDLIKVGRGGPGSEKVWTDLKLTTSEDVSREHFQIRRDPSTGSFFIKDLSKFGTTVNGKPVPPSVEKTKTGQIVDRDLEVELKDSVRIGLADVLFIEFRIQKQKKTR
jgi:hypothetical protein